MHYHNITKDDMLNGEGLRTVLWVAGCSHACAGCQNPSTWDACGGIPYDTQAEEELFSHLAKPYTAGLTFSGGDPLFPPNREEVTRIAKKAKSLFPDKKIWLYTGFLWEEIAGLPIMAYIDVLIDGKFIEAQKNPQLHWIGSENQRIIDVKQSRLAQKTILYSAT